jgi:hypothetical protein
VPNTYLWKILQREAVDTSMGAPARGVINALGPVLVDWSGGYLAAVHPSGSFAKGTANRSGTDIDVFVSMRSDCPGSLENIYSTLSRRLRSAGLDVRNQNVSLGTRIHGFDVDVVPARRQGPQGEDHSLWRNRANTWTKTNVAHHIQLVSGSGLQAPIRIMKLWRRQKGLVFPSFYLELAVIEALRNSRSVSSILGEALLRRDLWIRRTRTMSFPMISMITRKPSSLAPRVLRSTADGEISSNERVVASCSF